MNQFLTTIKKNIKSLFCGDFVNSPVMSTKDWKIDLKRNTNRTEYHYIMKHFKNDDNVNYKDTITFVLNKYDMRVIISLMYDFHYEVFKISNLRTQNKGGKFSIRKIIKTNEFEIEVMNCEELIVSPLQCLKPSVSV